MAVGRHSVSDRAKIKRQYKGWSGIVEVESWPGMAETPFMIAALADFFANRLTPAEDRHGEREAFEVRYAAAALLVVCAKSDFRDHPDEERAIVELLEKTFSLEHELIEEILSVLDEDVVVRGIQQFTSLVNKHYTRADKQVLIENLWQVAMADGHLDRFEEQYINRVSFMINMSPEEVLACRDNVAGN